MSIGVLHVINRFVRRSGPEQLVGHLLRKLDPQRFNSHLLQLDFGHFDGPSFLEEEVWRPEHRAHLKWSKWRLPILALETARLIRRWKVQLVHAHDIPSDLVVALTSVIVPGLQLVASRHGYIDYNAKLRRLYWLDNQLLRRFDQVIVGSEAMLTTLDGLDRAKVKLIPNAVSLDNVGGIDEVKAARRQLGLGDPDRLVLAVGRLEPEKGHNILIEAARHVCRQRPRTNFVVVGEGPLHAELALSVKQAGLTERFHLTGFQMDIRPWLAACDVFVQPSLQESLPLSLLEAMAWAKPVVCTAVGGIPDAVGRGNAGRLVPPGDPVSLAATLEEMLADEAGTTGLALAGRRRVESVYSDTAFATATANGYEELIAWQRK